MNTCVYHNGFTSKLSLMKIILNTSLLTKNTFRKLQRHVCPPTSRTTCLYCSHKTPQTPQLHPCRFYIRPLQTCNTRYFVQFSCWWLWSEIYSQKLWIVFDQHTEEKYPGITIYSSDIIFLGIQLDWEYNICIVNISMPNYVKKALSRFEQKNLNMTNIHHIHMQHQIMAPRSSMYLPVPLPI